MTPARYVPGGGGAWADPWPGYAALRDHDPVHRVVPPGRPDHDYYVLTRHADETGSTLASDLLASGDLSDFVKVLPRDYAAVLETRRQAVDEGLDPDGDIVWNRIMEVTGG